MERVGYSGKSLADKLGIRSGCRLAVINPPDHYEALIGPLAAGVERVDAAQSPSLLHVFVANAAELAALAPAIVNSPAPGGMIWVSWPKKSSTLFVDLTEDRVRSILLPTGWVDVKVCAVDADWSGLKFLRRRG